MQELADTTAEIGFNVLTFDDEPEWWVFLAVRANNGEIVVDDHPYDSLDDAECQADIWEYVFATHGCIAIVVYQREEE